MSHAIIRSVLEEVLQNWANTQSPVVQISFENDSTKNKDLFLETHLFPRKNRCETLDNSHECYLGDYQIDVNALKGYGPGIAENIAILIKQQYPNGLQLESGGIVVVITDPTTIQKSETTERRYVVPITVSYRCDIIN